MEAIMANLLKAIQSYTPRIKQGSPIKINDVAQYIAGRTALNEGSILNVLLEFQNSIIHYCSMGRPVKLEGLGIFSSGLNKNGLLRLNYRADKELIRKLSGEGFIGEMKNKDMIGKSTEEFIARWNREHPDDPIEE